MMKCGDKVILFGLSKLEYKPAEHYLEKYDKDHKVQMIIDNNPDFAGEFHGIPVRPQSALESYVNDETVTVIITARYRWEEIQSVLLEMGFSKDKIITAMEDRDFCLSYGTCYCRTKFGSKPLQPDTIRIELSRNCNCRCCYCPFHGKGGTQPERGFISWEVLKAVTEQIGKIPSLTTAYFAGRGEPCLHPEWYEMMEYVLSNSYVKDLLIYSNGMLLNQDTVQKLAKLPFRSLELEVSIDGDTPEENNLYRIGSDYETIRKHIYDAAEMLSGRSVRFVLTNTQPVTLDYLEQHDYAIPFDTPVPEFLQRDFPPEVRKVSHIAQAWQSHIEANGVSLSSQRVKDIQIKGPCEAPFRKIYVLSSGDILSCCIFSGIIGNVLKDDLFKVWTESAVMEELRQSIMNGKILEMCSECTDSVFSEVLLAVKSG